MKNRHMIIGLVLVLILPLLAIAGEIDPICGMDMSKSQTKYYFTTTDGKRVPLCSAYCAFQVVFLQQKATWQTTNIGDPVFRDAEGKPVGKLETIDFESRKEFNALKGWFVVNSDVIPKGSMEPYALGFSTIKRANSFLDRHRKPGVRVVNFETVTHDIVDKLRAEKKVGPDFVYPGVSGKEAPAEQIEMFIREKGMNKKGEKQ